MTTTLDLPDDLVDDIHLLAEQEGQALDETVAQLLRAGLAASSPRTTTGIQTTASMIARLRHLRHGVRLHGDNLRDLIEQGRRN